LILVSPGLVRVGLVRAAARSSGEPRSVATAGAGAVASAGAEMTVASTPATVSATTMAAIRATSDRSSAARALLLRRDAGPSAAQHELLDLASRGLGQLGHEVEPLRTLEVREALAHEVAQLALGNARTRADDHERVRALAPLLARHPDHRDLLDGGVAQQHALDLDRRDVLAAADDHVLDPVADLDVAVGM